MAWGRIMDNRFRLKPVGIKETANSDWTAGLTTASNDDVQNTRGSTPTRHPVAAGRLGPRGVFTAGLVSVLMPAGHKTGEAPAESVLITLQGDPAHAAQHLAECVEINSGLVVTNANNGTGYPDFDHAVLCRDFGRHLTLQSVVQDTGQGDRMADPPISLGCVPGRRGVHSINGVRMSGSHRLERPS